MINVPKREARRRRLARRGGGRDRRGPRAARAPSVGHARRGARTTIRTVPIGARGQYEVKVDARDYAWVTRWRWSFKRFSWRYGTNIYARRCVRRCGRNVTLLMHTEILIHRMGLPRPPKHTGEHININSLDNTRRNLAWATMSEQNANRRRRISKAEKVAFAVAAERELRR
jgi:hypothetical protein